LIEGDGAYYLVPAANVKKSRENNSTENIKTTNPQNLHQKQKEYQERQQRREPTLHQYQKQKQKQKEQQRQEPKVYQYQQPNKNKDEVAEKMTTEKPKKKKREVNDYREESSAFALLKTVLFYLGGFALLLYLGDQLELATKEHEKNGYIQYLPYSTYTMSDSNNRITSWGADFKLTKDFSKVARNSQQECSSEITHREYKQLREAIPSSASNNTTYALVFVHNVFASGLFDNGTFGCEFRSGMTAEYKQPTTREVLSTNERFKMEYLENIEEGVTSITADN